jgi:hypothetical protein
LPAQFLPGERSWIIVPLFPEEAQARSGEGRHP